MRRSFLRANRDVFTGDQHGQAYTLAATSDGCSATDVQNATGLSRTATASLLRQLVDAGTLRATYCPARRHYRYMAVTK